MKHSFLEETSFATLFPKYRENYLRSVLPPFSRPSCHSLFFLSFQPSLACRHASTQEAWGELRTEPSGRLDDGANHPEDEGPVHHPQVPGPAEAAGEVGERTAGASHSGRRHSVRHHQDRAVHEEQGALRQEEAETQFRVCVY